MKFMFSVGCSGSGKSTYYYKNLKDTFSIIEPDLIRKEFGDINDQSRNADVYMTAHKRLDEYLKDGKNVYFSATNLSVKSIKSLIDIAKEYTDDITCVIFNDSANWKLCKSRVAADLKNGVERSNTLVFRETEKGKIPLIKEMSDRFISLINNPEFIDLLEEKGVKIVNI